MHMQKLVVSFYDTCKCHCCYFNPRLTVSCIEYESKENLIRDLHADDTIFDLADKLDINIRRFKDSLLDKDGHYVGLTVQELDEWFQTHL
jgi:hypothetical protein